MIRSLLNRVNVRLFLSHAHSPPTHAHAQYYNSNGKLMMLSSDIALRTDPEFRKYVEVCSCVRQRVFVSRRAHVLACMHVNACMCVSDTLDSFMRLMKPYSLRISLLRSLSFLSWASRSPIRTIRCCRGHDAAARAHIALPIARHCEHCFNPCVLLWSIKKKYFKIHSRTPEALHLNL